MNLADLKKPFNPMEINWRCGATNGEKTKGIALAYLDARAVMERLDDVCGPENWQAEYPFLGCCRIGIKIGGLIMNSSNNEVEYYPGMTQAPYWVWKSNGAGQTDIEGEKGIYSDAFKRAAVLWGIGRYLYELPNTWFPIEAYGRSYRFSEDTQSELMKRLSKWQDGYFKSALWESKEQREKYIDLIRSYHDSGEPGKIIELFGELNEEQTSDVWRGFPAAIRSRITDDMNQYRSSKK